MHDFVPLVVRWRHWWRHLDVKTGGKYLFVNCEFDHFKLWICEFGQFKLWICEFETMCELWISQIYLVNLWIRPFYFVNCEFGHFNLWIVNLMSLSCEFVNLRVCVNCEFDDFNLWICELDPPIYPLYNLLANSRVRQERSIHSVQNKIKWFNHI